MIFNNRLAWLSVVLILCFYSCRPATYLKKIDTDFFRYQTGKTAAISAHRGGGNYPGYPENAVESFEWLAKQMPVIIECDISMTRDSILIMMHDDTFDRTTTGIGKIKDSSFAYSQTLNLKDNFGRLTAFKIPTLEKVLQWGNSKVAYTLDVKRGVPFENVIEQVRKYRSEKNAVIITYNANDAALVHKLAPELMISVTLRNEEEYQRHKSLGIPDNRMIAFIGTREPNEPWLKILHEKGILCILGTLGNLDKMASSKGDHLYKEWFEKGANILSTDRPIEAWKALQK